MGLKFNKTDKLDKLFEEFALDPYQGEKEAREKQVQDEADKFLKLEQEQLAKKKTEEKE